MNGFIFSAYDSHLTYLKLLLHSIHKLWQKRDLRTERYVSVQCNDRRRKVLVYRVSKETNKPDPQKCFRLGTHASVLPSFTNLENQPGTPTTCFPQDFKQLDFERDTA